jgi:DNA-binding NarL/FixJ family response regulator
MTDDPTTDVTVLVVDDQPRFLSVARTVIDRTPGFAFVGSADDGAAAVEAVGNLLPQLVLMDIHMPVLDGIAATRSICERWPDTVVVLLSSYDRDDLPHEVATSGAVGYLHKEELDAASVQRAWDARNGGDQPGGPAS